jgi:hypothetical protein
MFEVDGMKLIKLIARDGRIVKVLYPVFPPDGNSVEVTTWLRPRR